MVNRELSLSWDNGSLVPRPLPSFKVSYAVLAINYSGVGINIMIEPLDSLHVHC